MPLATNVGHHIVADLYFKETAFLNSVRSIRPLVEASIQEANLTILGHHFHQFSPFGATGIFLLSESHVAFHTWPEHGLLCIDVFSCSAENKTEKFMEALTRKIKPIKIKKTEVVRGKTPEKESVSFPAVNQALL
ncbi:adenosylmethionine decarboxylase [Candidatus Micrarchaeota archaeon]|nr:adenosylmethionine decarboxylase [Candidatus Micrarchaeota archaeon]MBU1930550.1 adenosylmethionine decarboxylase [Candidatus Micrarchaeota archaeon]